MTLVLWPKSFALPHQREVGRFRHRIIDKAEYIRLNWFVALKFLPDEVSRDPQVLPPFRREAQASAPNRPNTGTIHDTGEEHRRAFHGDLFRASHPYADRGKGLPTIRERSPRLERIAATSATISADSATTWHWTRTIARTRESPETKRLTLYSSRSALIGSI